MKVKEEDQEMGRMDYLAMKPDQELLNEDFNELKMATKKLINHAAKLGGLGFGTSFLKWVSSFAAMWAFYYNLVSVYEFVCVLYLLIYMQLIAGIKP